MAPKLNSPGGAIGTNLFSLPKQLEFRNVYPTLDKDAKTWRCERAKQSQDLMDEAWALLKPIKEGRWDKEKAYTGLALFAKGIYAGQGYPMMPTEMAESLGELMRIVQEHCPYVNSGGRRIQADDSPARYALRVTFNCMSMVVIAGLALVAPDGSLRLDDSAAEMQATAETMAAGCIAKLGGPLYTEAAMSPADRSALAALATNTGGEALSGLLAATPVAVTAIFMLQALYDIDLLTIKWCLHYAIARASKEAWSRAFYADRSGNQPTQASLAVAREAAVRCADATKALVALEKSHPGTATSSALEPGGPLAAFVAAEARMALHGTNRDTLAAMREAAKTAERKRDDLMAWLGWMSVAQLLVCGAEGATFSEDELLAALDAAAAQRASVKRWRGHFQMEVRTKGIREEVRQALEKARELAESSAAPLPPGRLPVPPRGPGHPTRMNPTPLQHRECANCKLAFHKTMLCGQCKSVSYCGPTCQKAHWRAGHKHECARLKAEAEAEAEAAHAGEGAGGPAAAAESVNAAEGKGA